MRLNNSTSYSDEDLRNFISVCAQKMEVTYILNGLRVTVKRRKISNYRSAEKDDYPTGVASLCNKWMRIRIPQTLNKRKLAFVVQHELYHTIGKGHRSLAREFGGWEISESDRFSFADNLLLNPKELNSPKPPRNIRIEREARAQNKVEELTRKLKRTKTLLRKWTRKVRYYEKIKRNS